MRLLAGEFRVESFWYNPNIHPGDEHDRRKDSLVRLVADAGLPFHEGPAESMESWIERWQTSGLDRCRFCYAVRLREAARTARRLAIGSFSTTLLASPYQKHDLIRELGMQAAADEEVAFVYRDFRPVYYEGKNEAWRRGSYMQKYCGCLYSRQERETQRQKRAAGRTS
jgi:predicted adenine nucleotide alpha hydrolase (AANH) superfamily ATPase